MYVFWKGNSTVAPIYYATTPDTFGNGLDGDATLTWSAPTAVLDSTGVKGLAQTTGSPAVASADIHGDGPLLLAYKGPSGFNIRYQTFDGTTGAARSSSTATTTPRLWARRWCTARWPTCPAPTPGSSCTTTCSAEVARC